MTLDSCNHCGTIILQQVLEAGIPALCPACGPVYSVAKRISVSPKVSVETQNIANLICVGLMAWAGLALVEQIAKAMKS